MTDAVVVDAGAAQLASLVDGPAGAPVVICTHGFTAGARSFRLQVAPLVERGFRVVRPALRGYAPSSTAADGRYDAEALAADLCALAMRFSSQPVALVGHDWGAVASYAAVALAPHLFSRLVTVAVPHLRPAASRFASARQLKRSWYIGLFQLPAVAERKLAAGDFALIERLWRDWSPGWQPPAEELAAIKDAVRDPERTRAALAYYRALRSPAAVAGEARRLLFRRVQVPSMYIHGLDDGCVGVELSEGLESGYGAPLEVHRIPGGHFVHQENPLAFNRLLIRFLAEPR